MTDTPPETAVPFSALRDQIDGLRERPAIDARAGHRELAPDLWLSTDPSGQAWVGFAPTEAGFELRVNGADSGAWAALGMRLAAADLAPGRYLGLRLAVADGDVAAFTPTLRYYLPDGSQDVRAPIVILPGGPREHLAWLPIDHALLQQATGCELNLFFHTDAFRLDLAALEPLLMI